MVIISAITETHNNNNLNMNMNTNMAVANKPNYLIGVSLVTHGFAGDNLGGDEAEIIQIGWVVVETENGKIITMHCSYVQPRDLSKVNWQVAAERGVTEDDIKYAPTFAEALQKFETYLDEYLLQTNSANGGGSVSGNMGIGGPSINAALVSDGPLPVRQVLHPEAMKKAVQLPPHYWTFFDIRKKYGRLFSDNQESQPVPTTQPQPNTSTTTLDDVLTGLNGNNNNNDTQVSLCVKMCHNLGTAIANLVVEARNKGLECFGEPEVVKPNLEHGICTKDDVIDGNTVIRARGLPWQSSDDDVAKFFAGLNIAKGGVALVLSHLGRRNGEALVRFETAEQREMALKRHRHFMGDRYIEVYRATGEDFIKVAAGNNDAAQQFLSLTDAVIVRMRGLPYDCTAEKIVEFFKSGENPVVGDIDPEKDILFVNKTDGKATGDAFVRFYQKGDDLKALAKHKESIGPRYIELFRSTTAEVQQVLNKTMETAKPPVELLNQLQPSTQCLVTSIPSTTAIMPGFLPPQPVVISGSRKDCLRLRGLPYESQVQHILDFLGEFAKNVLLQGVHMVLNAQGHPSGEAFIQLDSEVAASAAASERHNKYMQIGKKQRYIEVFQCSADDMNLVLTGPAALHTSLISQATAALQARPMISPGGNLYSTSNPLTAATGLLPAQFFAQSPLSPQVIGAAGALQNGALAAAAAQGAFPNILNGAGRLPIIPNLTGHLPAVTSPGTVLYWPYPSPPVSPSSFYAAIIQAQQPGIVLLRGLPFNVSVADILTLFQGYPDLTAECVQIQRTATGQPTGEALVTFPTRFEAERAVLEKNRQILGARPVELYIYGI